MQFYFKFIILLCSIIFTKHGLGLLSEGDLCTMDATETNGICKLISFCPSAVQVFKNHGIFPKNCGFKNNEPMVCCNASATNALVAALHTTTTTTIPPAITQNVILQGTSSTRTTATVSPTTTRKVILEVGGKSKQKCKEYGENALQYNTTIVTIFNNYTLSLIDDCAVFAGLEGLIGPPKPKEFPHMALIGFDNGDNEIHWDCSGSLISEKFVLSAAHCTYHIQYLEPKHILLGELILDTETDDAMPQKIRIKNIILHPDYQFPSAYNDIALFELEYNVILNTYIRPACLNTNPNLTNRFAIESGWGSMSSIEDLSKGMRNHYMNMIYTNSECNHTYRRNINVTVANGIVEEIQLCAGINQLSNGHPCLGNSGGPLQIVSRDLYCMYDIIGIASFGKFCGRVNNPGVYTRVSAYVKWIEDIVWP